jgi:hypothetical protein
MSAVIGQEIIYPTSIMAGGGEEGGEVRKRAGYLCVRAEHYSREQRETKREF